MNDSSLEKVIFMLERKAYSQMKAWKNTSSKKALLITGARQVGKTYLTRQFAQENYEMLLEINLIEQPEATKLFSSPKTAADIVSRLGLAAGKKLIPGKSLVFIDEIQNCPEVMTAIKFLVDEGSFDYVLSGSLLGTELRDVRSVPVGYVRELKMFPLDFEEFCWSQGVEKTLLPSLKSNLVNAEPINEFVHTKLLDLFYRYLVVGGMPDAVAQYCEDADFLAVRQVQSDIRAYYRHDISQYCLEADRLHVREVFDLIPSELNNSNKRFILKNLNENARFREFSDAFIWLDNAGVALPTYNVDEPVAPLLASKKRNLFKLLSSDVGLLNSCYSTATSLAILDGGDGVNCGAMFENAVAQELFAHGFSLYYFNSKKHGELDFVVEDRDGRVIPIEVKSGKSYTRHRALSNIMEVTNYNFDCAYVFGPNNIEAKNGITYAPIYMVSLLHND